MLKTITKKYFLLFYFLVSIVSSFRSCPVLFQLIRKKGNILDKYSHTIMNRAHYTSNFRLGLSIEDIQVGIYDLQLKFSNLIETDLQSHLGPAVTMILISAGVLSSLSPCSLGLIPITLSYLLEPSENQNRNNNNNNDNIQMGSTISIRNRAKEPSSPQIPSAESYLKLGFYSIGVVLAFTILGASATLVGTTINKLSVPGIELIRDLGIPAIYLSLGLSLLEILPPINLAAIRSKLKGRETSSSPSSTISSSVDKSENMMSRQLQKIGKGIFVGLTAAIVGTSCTTPVLTALLTFLGNQGSMKIAMLALFFYSVGYLLPLLFSLLVVNQIKLSEFGGKLEWINDLFAMIMLGYGSYLLFNTIFQTFHLSS